MKPHAPTPSRYAALIALALALPIGLVGCAAGDSSGQAPEQSESSNEGGTDGADSGSATGEAGDPVALGLPDDFPSDVPIVKGEVLTAQQKGIDPESPSWSVEIKVEGNVCDFIDTQMADAGYEQFRDVALSGGCAVSYKNDTWTVSIGVGDKPEAGWVAGYDFGHI